MDPRPEDIHLDDIVCSLSKECRWNNFLPCVYTVLQHTLLVADIVKNLGGSQSDIFAALHHEDSEAYIRDIPSPLKHSVGMEAYIVAENAIMDAAAEKFGFEYPLPEVVHSADKSAEYHEAIQLRGSDPKKWDGRYGVIDGEHKDVVVDTFDIGVIVPQKAITVTMEWYERHWEYAVLP